MTAPSLSGADSISLVIHGVGDHSREEVLGAAEEYLATASTPEPARQERIAIESFPSPYGGVNRQAALLFSIGGKTHALVAVEWSDIHERVSHSTDPALTMAPLSQRLAIMIGQAALPILQTCWNTFRCVPRATGGLWKVLLAGEAVLFSVGAFAVLLLPLILSIVLLVFLAQRLQHAAPLAGALLLPLAWVVSRKAAQAIRRSYFLFDFIDDVAFYVGQEPRRLLLIGRVRGMIEAVARLAPRARILAIGHSLGSVLMSQAVSSMEPRSETAGRLWLVTLGSPLWIMGRMFAGTIPSPSQVAQSVLDGKRAARWINAWRDRDFIGRELLAGPVPHFSEVALGDGVHPDYWGDDRLWSRLRTLLDVGGELGPTWTEEPVTPEEAREGWERVRRFRATAHGNLLLETPGLGWAVWVLFRARPAADWDALREDWLWVVLAAGCLLCAASAILLFRLERRRIVGSFRSAREWLANVRLYSWALTPVHGWLLLATTALMVGVFARYG